MSIRTVVWYTNRKSNFKEATLKIANLLPSIVGFLGEMLHRSTPEKRIWKYPRCKYRGNHGNLKLIMFNVMTVSVMIVVVVIVIFIQRLRLRFIYWNSMIENDGSFVVMILFSDSLYLRFSIRCSINCSNFNRLLENNGTKEKFLEWDICGSCGRWVWKKWRRRKWGYTMCVQVV